MEVLAEDFLASGFLGFDDEQCIIILKIYENMLSWEIPTAI